MERCGFFDANLVGEEYDRVYLASQFAAYFASFIGNGVFAEHSNQLQVMEMATPQMQIGVERGQAWINGYWYENTDMFYLPIDVADGVLNRIDSVVLRLGFSERNMWLAVKKGTPAINPIAPEVTRTADYYELQLATISIPAGSIKITQAQITDTRMNQDVCGWVTGVVDQIDTTGLFAQYQTAFNDWFQELKDALDDNTAANLLSLINQLDDDLTSHKNDKDNPHEVTAAQIGAATAQSVQNLQTEVGEVANELTSHKSDYEYQTPIIDGTQIQLQKQSDTNILKFKLDTDLSGEEITISLDAGVTEKPLVDIDGVAVTELSKGFVEVIEDAVNFTYAPKGSSLKFVDNIVDVATLAGIGTVRDMQVDDDYLYILTSTQLCKVSKETYEVVLSVNLTEQYSKDLNMDSTYLYFILSDGTSTIFKILKYRKSDLVKVAETSNFSYSVSGMTSNTNYLFLVKENGGGSYDLAKHNKSNLSLVGIASSIFPFTGYLSVDDSYAYFAGSGTIKKYDASTMALVSEVSVANFSPYRNILHDTTDVYVGTNLGGKNALYKFLESTLVLSSVLATEAAIYRMVQDATYIYASYNTGKLRKVRKSNLHIVGGNEVYSATMMSSDGVFVYTYKSSSALFVKYNLELITYYKYKDLKLTPIIE